MSRSRPEQAKAGPSEPRSRTSRCTAAAAATARRPGPGDLLRSVTPETRAIVDRRARASGTRRRGWLVRRLLVFGRRPRARRRLLATELLFGPPGPTHADEWLVLAVVLPVWILMAKVYGLYDRDEERADHSTIDDAPGVFHLVTVGVWLLFIGGRLTGAADPTLTRLVGFWLLAIVLVAAARADRARACAPERALPPEHRHRRRRRRGTARRAQARCSIRNTGSTSSASSTTDPRERRPSSSTCRSSAASDGLPEIVEMLDVDRVIVAFSQDAEPETVDLSARSASSTCRSTSSRGCSRSSARRSAIHSVEALPLVGLPPVDLSRRRGC